MTQLLTPAEMARVQQIGVNRSSTAELLAWAMEILQEQKDAGRLDPPLASTVRYIHLTSGPCAASRRLSGI